MEPLRWSAALGGIGDRAASIRIGCKVERALESLESLES